MAGKAQLVVLAAGFHRVGSSALPPSGYCGEIVPISVPLSAKAPTSSQDLGGKQQKEIVAIKQNTAYIATTNRSPVVLQSSRETSRKAHVSQPGRSGARVRPWLEAASSKGFLRREFEKTTVQHLTSFLL